MSEIQISVFGVACSRLSKFHKNKVFSTILLHYLIYLFILEISNLFI